MAGPDWRSVFGHDSPYDEQVEGIETAIATARERGFTLVEGACGTGKTMLALTAGITLVRDPTTRFERVVALTSVKQQLKQFETDLRLINEDRDDRVSGLTIVGKADVCPYAREGLADIDETSVYERCEGLRERTRALAGDGNGDADALAAAARRQQMTVEETSAEYLETAGEIAPYGPTTAEDRGSEYCPFYAAALADAPGEDGDPADAIPFDHDAEGHIDADRLVALSIRAGTCPHTIMGHLLGEVEVVLGNYYHAFDPVTTQTFTGPLIDDSTFVICDEAHMLEPRVRDLVSEDVAEKSLLRAEREIARLVEAADAAPGKRMAADPEAVRAELAEADTSMEELKHARTFLRDLRDELDRRVRTHLDAEYPGWEREPLDTEVEPTELPLRDPEEPTTDAITRWAADAGYDAPTWTRLPAVAAFVSRLLSEHEDEDREYAVPGVARTLSAWYQAGNERFFREIEISPTTDRTEAEWRQTCRATLALQNCVPSGPIGDRLADFGGGILMSATLEPLSVFRRVTGLATVAAETDRPVVERRYGLTFPAENRASFAVDAPPFTYANRGAPGENTDTRRDYADAIRSVARGPGNVLVGMPSYAEAEWAADILADLDKPILVDKATDAGATDDLKADFFAGEGKVLVTSLRGTLTEGVDYRGDRLRAAIVCGVPIIDTSSPRTKAVVTAYERTFGDGFEYALTVPAVRKARQAIGRVIRGPDEVGVRVLCDARYARDTWNSVREVLPDDTEFQSVSQDMLDFALDSFRSDHGA
ncbi:ATP-dependent DNA helicase [Halobacteriales archaeon SW_7_68_16]|nr:MAG: ATP-dependent DNA helicase [Halobacteriales archaeon SW_7_68_16]